MDATAAVHPNDQILQAYGLGKLDDASSESVSKHLEECPSCQRRVAEMSADSFVGRLRGAQGSPEMSGTKRSEVGGLYSDRSPAAAIAPPPADTLPSGLADHPDYEIVRELGRGGMGVVYLARNRLMGRPEVLKVVGGQLVERPGVRDRFLREVQSAAKLHVEYEPTASDRASTKNGLKDHVAAHKFVPLFNGKDKTGWIESPSNHGEWKVVDGVLQARGTGPKGTRYAVLNTQRQNFTNFRLHLKFRYPREGRGQIEIRHEHVSNSRDGYMINQSSWPTTDQWQIPTGSITKMRNLPYGAGTAWDRLAVAFPVPINTWNTMDITAVKARIVTSVNGKEVADYTDAAGWFGSGGISLAAWYDAVVDFQEITIEELPE